MEMERWHSAPSHSEGHSDDKSQHVRTLDRWSYSLLLIVMLSSRALQPLASTNHVR